MSINHLIDSGATPKYDIFVNGIAAEDGVIVAGNVEVDGSIESATSMTAPTITASDEMLMALQNNYNDVLNDVPFAFGSFLFDQGNNTFTNLSDIFEYLTTRKVATSGFVDTYKFSWSGEASVLSDNAIFDFRALYDYDKIAYVSASCQFDLAADVNDVGFQILPPDDPANDFEIEFDTTNVSSLLAGDVVLFFLEIQLFRIS